MASTISTSNAGTTFISGTFSGLDVNTLIQNAVNARLAPKQHYQDQISTNLKKITAFQALRSQSDQLKGLFDQLKSDLVGNVFDQKQASYASSSSTPAAGLLSATLTKDALTGNHSVIVQQVAKTFTATSVDQTSQTTALGQTGTFDIGQAGSTAQTISITATDTLQSLRNKINAVSTTTGVSADILQVSPGIYRLVVKGSKSAQAVSVSNITGNNVLQSLGVTNGSGTFTNVTQPAQQAKITLDGTDIYSNTNEFSNVLTGVTINVTNADPATTITLTAGNNIDGVKTAIQGVVDGYNSLLDTVAANQEVNADGTVADSAFLFNEYLNTSLGTRLTQLAAGTYGTGVFNGLRSLGISINSSNRLEIDTNALNQALNNHYSDVRSVFETQGSNVGLADAASSFINGYSNFVSGSIQTQIKSLQTVNSDLTQRSDDIQTSVNQYQLELINKYAQMEAKMKKADIVKRQVQAIIDAGRLNT